MTDMFRDCPECSSQRRFSQHHGEPAQCPDSADGLCPDWFCADCGTGLLIALLPATKAQVTAGAAGGASGIATAGKLGRVA